MNFPTMMVKIAALAGHPIPMAAQAAAFDDTEGVHVRADASEQIRRGRGVRGARGIEYARRAGADGAPLPLRLDVLAPTGSGSHPLVVYIPGGGFVRSARAGGARMRRHIAAHGYVVASIEYRTVVHAATWTDGIADVRAAIAHLRRHARDYGIDPQRVAVWGESAGGYLAAMTGVNDARDRQEDEAPLLAVIDKFGGSALGRIAEGFDRGMVAKMQGPGSPIARYVHGPGGGSLVDDSDALRQADPATLVSPSTAPFLLFHGSDDRMISPVQTGALHRALRAASVDSTWFIIDGAGHGDLAAKGGEEKFWTTVPMMRLMTDFLDRTVRHRVLDD